MKLQSDELVLAATDLANHLGCRHLSHLDHRRAHGLLEKPKFVDPVLEILQQRGDEHEAAYLAHLRDRGKTVVELGVDDWSGTAVDNSLAAMRGGADVIFQPLLRHERWQGRADFLIRVDKPSDLGAYSYEVQDTKLAQNTKAGTILQLCLYSEMVAALQGTAPEAMHVVKPGSDFEPEPFRVQEFEAYYRWVKARLEDAVDGDDPTAEPQTYPDPVPQCDICRWRPRCNRQRRADDHLSLVAGMHTLHMREFHEQGTTKLEELGDATQALEEPPKRGHIATYEKLREQARVQLAGRRRDKHVAEFRPLEEGRGFYLLPEPSPGDVFFDFEGDAFVEGGGLEDPFGWVEVAPASGEQAQPVYHGEWAFDRAAERRAFEQFVDAMTERWRAHPDMHIYHFAPYEPAALKRLASRHGTRENEVDSLLRARVFVDLHAVARQGLICSVERYGLKELEPFFGFRRDVDLDQAGRARRRIEHTLELGFGDGTGSGAAVRAAITDEDHTSVEGYNRDDCEGTRALRDWLESKRAERIAAGDDIPRPVPGDGEPPEGVKERDQKIQDVFDAVVQTLPEDRDAWSDEHRAIWLLAHLFGYFRREGRVTWWDFFARRAFEFGDALKDRKAVAGLSFVGQLDLEIPNPNPTPLKSGKPRKPLRRTVQRYRYPDQELSFDADMELYESGGDPERDIAETKLGTVFAVHHEQNELDVVKVKERRGDHPTLAFVHREYRSVVMEDSVLDLGRLAASDGLEEAATGLWQPARDLLLRRPPRLRAGSASAGQPLRQPGEPVVDAAVRLARDLDGGALAIQGPPGAGKTWAGGQMILALLREGKRVGVTAVGHKVIVNLLARVQQLAVEHRVSVEIVHKVSKWSAGTGFIQQVTGNADAERAVQEGKLVGGTAYLWLRPELQEQVDYLFVDEAGQMSLAMVVAASRAAKNVVLLGDPAQLEQPQQGSHPEGADVSALEHLLAGNKTMPPERGLFLDRTWRLHPDICTFTSQLHYEGLLESRDGLVQQQVRGGTAFGGSGLFYVAVEHEGNQSSSPEEVAAVQRVVAELQRDGVAWVGLDGDGEAVEQPLRKEDVLIVAPYNAQISALERAMPEMAARIGTVDKFQGQEAAVVVYSMTSSSPEDAPRGLSFLYNPNRLNVATSRARCGVVLVANPRLFEPECRSPEQMRWANGLCLFRELARVVEV